MVSVLLVLIHADFPIHMILINEDETAKIVKTCDWVPAEDTITRCAVEGMNHTCCKTCETC